MTPTKPYAWAMRAAREYYPDSLGNAANYQLRLAAIITAEFDKTGLVEAARWQREPSPALKLALVRATEVEDG